MAFFFGYLYSRSVSLSMFYHFLAKWRWWPIVVVAALFPGISGIIFLLFLLFFFRSWALVAGYTGGGVVPVVSNINFLQYTRMFVDNVPFFIRICRCYSSLIPSFFFFWGGWGLVALAADCNGGSTFPVWVLGSDPLQSTRLPVICAQFPCLFSFLFAIIDFVL